MMKAIEFKSKIRENKILIPRRMQHELALAGKDKSVRVVILLNESDDLRKTEIDEALEDVAMGRIYTADNAKDLIARCLQ